MIYFGTLRCTNVCRNTTRSSWMFINAIFYKTSSALGFKALAPHVQTWRLGRSGCSRCGCWSRINNCWRCRSSLNRGRGGFCSLALAISKTPDGTLWMTRPLTFDQSLAPLSAEARATVVRYVNTVISWLNICFTFFKIVACLNQIIAFTEFNLKMKIYIIQSNSWDISDFTVHTRRSLDKLFEIPFHRNLQSHNVVHYRRNFLCKVRNVLDT